MPITDRDVATFARDCAAGRNPHGLQSIYNAGGNCWQSAVYCVHLAGAITQARYQTQRAQIVYNNFTSFITLNDPIAPNAAMLRAVPQGHVLGFLEQKQTGWEIMHAMVSLGQGYAVGIANGCINNAFTPAWSVIDVASRLNWVPATGHFNAYPPGAPIARPIYIRHRSSVTL